MGPVSQPKVVRPLRVAPVSFEQVLSNKLHSTSVIQPIASKKLLTALLLSKLAKPTKPHQQPSLTDASAVKSKIMTLPHTSNPVTASHDMLSHNFIILQGTHEKKRILSDYQEKFGSEYYELIVTRKKGKISDDTSLYRARMRPSLDKWYLVGDLHLYNVITIIIKECRVIFLIEDLSNLFLVNKDFANIVLKVLCWLQVNFTPLQDPPPGYKQQDHINPYCVEMASLAMIHFGLDPGKFVRFLLGKVAYSCRNPPGSCEFCSCGVFFTGITIPVPP